MATPITDFDDKVAVVTGGASGVGKALGRMLLDRGAHVVIADVEQSALDGACDELQSRASTTVLAIRTDVTDAGSVQALADEVFSTFGRVNVLFNNAGRRRAVSEGLGDHAERLALGPLGEPLRCGVRHPGVRAADARVR